MLRIEKVVLSLIGFTSLLLLLFLFSIVYLNWNPAKVPVWTQNLDKLNAILNTLSSISLLLGYKFILKSKIKYHITSMCSAFIFSTCFLISYLIYHYFHGDTLFTGTGGIRIFYFSVLISHILLSIIMVPMILTTFFYALSKDFSKHKRIARITLPIWIYVSISGVLIYFMLNNM